jgi:hypothetical protein
LVPHAANTFTTPSRPNRAAALRDRRANPAAPSPFGIPRGIHGRRARIDLGLAYSTAHLALDVAVYGYLAILGGHDQLKVCGVAHLCARFGVAASTMTRALRRLTAPPFPHPPYLDRHRRGRGETAGSRTRHPHVHVQTPAALIRDTGRIISPADLRLWCVLQDRSDVDGVTRLSQRDLLAEFGSANTTNPSSSWVAQGLRSLHAVGWAVVVPRPGLPHGIAVCTERVDVDQRAAITAAIRAADLDEGQGGTVVEFPATR